MVKLDKGTRIGIMGVVVSWTSLVIYATTQAGLTGTLSITNMGDGAAKFAAIAAVVAYVGSIVGSALFSWIRSAE